MASIALKVREGETPGEAVIEVSAPGTTLPAQPLLAIRRRGYELGDLGPGGWQMAEASLAPLATVPTPDGATLRVGPEIAQHLDRGNYEVTLTGAGLSEPLTGVMAWNVRGGGAPVRRRAGRLAGVAADPEETPRVQPRVLVPEVRPEAEEQGLVVPKVVPDVVPDVVPERGEQGDGLGQRGQVVPPVPSPLRRYWPALAALAVVLLAGGGYALWPRPVPVPIGPVKKPCAGPVVPGSSCDKLAGPSGGNAAGGDANGSTTPGPGPVVPPVVVPPVVVPPPGPVNGGTTAPAVSPVEQARRFLETNPSAAAIYAKALEFQGQGSMDAAVPLFRAAADGGEARAADALGRLYDPADLSPAGGRRTQIPEPNPLFAAMWYKRGAAAGDNAAALDLQTLLNWAKARAAQGDQAATDLLAKLQP